MQVFDILIWKPDRPDNTRISRYEHANRAREQEDYDRLGNNIIAMTGALCMVLLWSNGRS